MALRALIVAFLLVFAGNAHALPLRGGGTSCPSPLVNGSTITAPSTCILGPTYGGTWQFTGSPNAFGDYSLTVTGSGTTATIDPCVLSAEQCVYWFYKYTATQGLYEVFVNHNANIQASSPGNPATGFFVNNTHTSACSSIAGGCSLLSSLFATATNGDTLETKLMPAGVPLWYFGSQMTGSNLTANFDSGVIFCCDISTSGGTAGVLISGNNDTLNGGEWSNYHAGGATYAWTAANGAQNPTFENAYLHDADTVLSTGGNNGFVVALNMKIDNGGTNATGGNDHNLYWSMVGCGIGVANQNPCPPGGTIDPGAYDIENMVSTNVVAQGWTLKLRPGGGTTSHTTHCSATATTADCIHDSIIGCTKSGTACNQNGIVDIPCGGQVQINDDVLEEGPGSNNANWYKVKYLEEASATQSSASCPKYGLFPTYAITVDKTIVIDDTTALFGSGVNNFICIYPQSGGNCFQGPYTGFSITCTITNSIFVSNTGSQSVAMTPGGGCTSGGSTGCTLVSGKCTDANNNRWYKDRPTAAANEGWNGTSFTDPISGVVTTCTVANSCAFPYLPAHL